MSCSDSSSSIALKLNNDERFLSFEFTKITCGKEITAYTDYNTYCRGKTLKEIFDVPYREAVENLNAATEEDQFVLYLEWDALRSAIAQYLGADDESIDKDRCRIASIARDDKEGVEIIQVILPPRDMPKILPCDHSDSI
ncbi:MAG: hypothetical protein KAS66_01830 [Candidatus Omnitrophica bacterium]|nr:hypothetical protein [Candidatus Omnitrophota bacterium]